MKKLFNISFIIILLSFASAQMESNNEFRSVSKDVISITNLEETETQNGVNKDGQYYLMSRTNVMLNIAKSTTHKFTTPTEIKLSVSKMAETIFSV